MPPRRDRTTGLPLPSPVDPGQTLCVQLVIPNAPEYRQAFRGVLSELGKPWTWSMTSGEDNTPAYEAAELWRAAIEDLLFVLDCGEGMTCDDVNLCIQSNSTTRTVIQSISQAAPIDGYTYPPGTPLTPSQMTAPLNEIDACAFDPYWAQVEQFTDYIVDLGQDVLDKIAAYSAALDAGENVPMGQFLGKLKNSSTAGKVIDFLQWVLVTVKAAYESADDTPNRTAIKCAIFCDSRDACAITIQGVLDVLNERNGGLLTPTDLEDLPALVDAFMAAVFNPALALDLWILFLMGSAKTAGMFGLQGIDETLNLVLKLAVNDANNDWEAACEDCAPPPTDRTPVINSEWDPPNIAGTLSGPDLDGYYVVTATDRTTDFAFCIMDTDARQFKLTDISFTFRPQCSVLYDNPTMLYIGCPGAEVYTNETVTELWSTWTTAQGVQSMQFKMVAP